MTARWHGFGQAFGKASEQAAGQAAGQVRRSRTYRVSGERVSKFRKPCGKKTHRGEILDKAGMRQIHYVDKDLEAGEQIPALARLDRLLDELHDVEEKREELKKNAVGPAGVVDGAQNEAEWVLTDSSMCREFRELTTLKKMIEEELNTLAEEIHSSLEFTERIFMQHEAFAGDAYFTTMVALDQLIFSLPKSRLGNADLDWTCVLQVLVFVPCLAFQGIIIVYLSIATLAMYNDACKIRSHLTLRVTGAAIFVGEMFSEFVEVSDLYAATTGTRTDCAKWSSRCLVICPKVMIAICLLVVGTCFVCLSEDDTELILNCLAMNFVLKIDELVQGILTKGQYRLSISVHLFLERMICKHGIKLVEPGSARFNCCVGTCFLRAMVWAIVVTAFIVLLPPVSGVLATHSGVFFKPFSCETI